MPQTKQINKIDQTERLIEAVENLSFSIDNLKANSSRDYSPYLTNIFISLKILDKIQHELHILNKTFIMSALLLSATKNPEKTLNEYHKIIDQYLN